MFVHFVQQIFNLKLKRAPDDQNQIALRCFLAAKERVVRRKLAFEEPSERSAEIQAPHGITAECRFLSQELLSQMYSSILRRNGPPQPPQVRSKAFCCRAAAWSMA